MQGTGSLSPSLFIFICFLRFGGAGLRCCAGFSPAVAGGGHSPGVVLRLLTVAASPAAGAQTQQLWHSGLVLRRAAYLPGSGTEARAPALAGDSLSLSHQGHPPPPLLKNIFIYSFIWLHWVLVAAHKIFDLQRCRCDL